MRDEPSSLPRRSASGARGPSRGILSERSESKDLSRARRIEVD
ncbi:MAG: hypothetical protein AAFQ43_15395 [Bacteroidota bacterium]